MRKSHVCGPALATSVIALGIGLAAVPAASADPIAPADPVQAEAPTPGPAPWAAPAPGPAALDAPVPEGDNSAAVTACSQFAGALDYAATNFSDFANDTAGDKWSYADPTVTYSNVTGRTALREAAAAGLSASATPGLQPEISAPMRAWSMDATKLLVLMGIHAPMDSINGKASDLNNETTNAQMACAAAGTHA
jgi:hypothetical protein